MDDKIRELNEKGLSIRNIADKLGVSKSKVGRILSQNKSVPTVPNTTVPNTVPHENTTLCPHYETIGIKNYEYAYCNKKKHALGGKHSNCEGDVDSCSFV